jgi:ketosteroid isomerase-like protein
MDHSNADIPALIAAAIDQQQVEPLLARMAPGAIVWHNTDRVEADAAASFSAVAASPMRFRIDQRRVISTPDAVVIQFVMQIDAESPVELHCCMVVSLEGGTITRIDEYLDPAAAALSAAY